MASRLLSRSYRPICIVGITAFAGYGFIYLNHRSSYRLDSPSGASPPRTTLALPTGMLFSKQLTVTQVEQINHDTKRLTFSLPGRDSEISGVPASSAILTQHTPPGAWFPVFRPYTPISDAETRGSLQLLVKQYPGGRASTYLHSLNVGDQLTVRGPLPGYSWKPSSKPRDVLLVAGGAGITPLYSLIKSALQDPTDKTHMSLLWGVNGTRDMVLANEFAELQASHPDRLKVTYVVSNPDTSSVPSIVGSARFEAGYIDLAVLQNAVRGFDENSWGDAAKGTKVFFCGPPNMQKAITGQGGALAQLGVSKKQEMYVF